MPMARRSSHRHGTLPPAFAAWLAIRSRGPICERRGSFSNFYADVGPRPSWRHLLVRDNPAGALEPGNARWRIAARIVPRDVGSTARGFFAVQTYSGYRNTLKRLLFGRPKRVRKC